MENMDIYQWITIACIIGIAAAIQSAIGFGFALVAVPLMLTTSLEMCEIVSMAIGASVVQRFLQIRSLRSETHFKENSKFILVSLLGIPIGVFCLSLISSQEKDVIRQGIGLLIMVMIITQYTIKVKPKDIVANKWGFSAFFASGFLNGLANVGGPPIILWILAHKWNPKRIRVTPAFVTIFAVPLQLGLYIWTFNVINVLWPLLIGIAMFPVTWLGYKGGSYIGHRFNEKILRIIIIAALIGMSAWYVVGPYLK